MPEPIMLPATSAVAPKRPTEPWPATAVASRRRTVVSDAAIEFPQAKIAAILDWGHGRAGVRSRRRRGYKWRMADRILVLYGSYRTDRLGIRLADYVVARLRARGAEPELIDAKRVGLPMLDRMYKE